MPLRDGNPRTWNNVWSPYQVIMNYSVKVLRANNLSVGEQNKPDKKLLVHIGLYHGVETLCPTVFTKKDVSCGNPNGTEFYSWNETCEFDLAISNLPRNARLCIAICTVKRARRNKQDGSTAGVPIAWLNVPVFDFSGYLKQGKHTFNCWPWPVRTDDGLSVDSLDGNNLNPLGGVAPNHDIDAPILTVEFSTFVAQVAYPSHAKVLEHAANQGQNFSRSTPGSYMKTLDEILKKDQLSDNEKDLLWDLRLDVRDNYPQQLDKVLASVKWNSFKCVSIAQALLESWTPLDQDHAMGLLESKFADERVRSFGVSCLEKLRDDELQQYLLQFVQALKFDSYVDSTLVQFMLNRAWKNRKLGHFLFWHLKSEIDLPSTKSTLRYALILEAYLYGNIPHMELLYKQNEALHKMKALNERVKNDKEFPMKQIKDKAREALQETAKQESFRDAMQMVECPLQPSVILESLKVEKMKVMNSKMRPLWLVYDTKDSPNSSMSIIYKNGDDLRQDMLTLQIISIMDTLWKEEGLDLRMIPYGCLATGHESGLIRVVTQSNTVANIQKGKGSRLASSFRYQTLFEWIKEHNQSEIEQRQAIENFTYSCAGYCVATYVLGVGDRHSDNIMVTEKGSLFHIDFGHILGNFKSKLGIKRERVPFVLAHDFVHVINKGKTNNKEDFEIFRKLCERAFCILRKRGRLFMTLFSLMLQSGLQELRDPADLDYLRDTLQLHMTEEQAVKAFKSKFNKALADAWSTSINWFFHNNVRDNA